MGEKQRTVRGNHRLARTALLALLFLGVAPALQCQNFQFVVIGDTRPTFESEDFQRFETLIPLINDLHPALVINLGDLIYGYGLLRKERQWDKYERVIKQIKPPYYQIPGNHDTYSREARRIYGRRFQKFYDSFDYQNCHFVLLDNTEQGRWGYMGPSETAWLKADLEKSKAAQVFVFMHFPVWDPDRVTARSHDFWLQTLHPLFRAHRVKAVFGGHYHSYGPTREFDGIRYFITGGGGAELRPEYRRSGGEFHFIRVNVSGNGFDMRVVTERGEKSDTEADVMGGLQFGDRNSSRIGIKPGTVDLKEGVVFSVSVHNPERDYLSGKAQWLYDESTFSIEPKEVPIQVAPGATERATFKLKTFRDTAMLQSLPRLAFDTRSGGRHHRFHRDVRFLQELNSAYHSEGPMIDGSLDDWGVGTRLRLHAGDRSDAEIRSFHDRDNLYMAVTIPEVNPPAEEESPDELQIGLARRLTDTDFGPDFIRLGFNRDSTDARNRTPGRKRNSFMPGVKCVSRRSANHLTFEVSVPMRLLKHLISREEHRLVLNLSFRLPDHTPAGAEEPAVPPQNSFYYSVRYGSDSLLPVNFVELNLEQQGLH